MAQVLIAALSPAGHFDPLLSVARSLVNRGDRVTVLTAQRHAAAIRAAGAPRTRCPGRPTSTRTGCAVLRGGPGPRASVGSTPT